MAKQRQNNSSVQSLTRGMTVLRLLARHGTLTASAIAEALGLHQSSASRLLRSLQLAGFVYKPDFHSFGIDYGALLFAGTAMEGFAEMGAAAQVCSDLHARTGFGAAAAVLWENRLIYLAFVGDSAGGDLKLVDDSSFPVHESTLGLCLAVAAGPEVLRTVIAESLRRSESACGAEVTVVDRIAIETEAAVSEYGFVYFSKRGQNNFNGAVPFATPRGRAALALFGREGDVPAAQLKAMLDESTAMIEALIERGSCKVCESHVCQ